MAEQKYYLAAFVALTMSYALKPDFVTFSLGVRPSWITTNDNEGLISLPLCAHVHGVISLSNYRGYFWCDQNYAYRYTLAYSVSSSIVPDLETPALATPLSSLWKRACTKIEQCVQFNLLTSSTIHLIKLC